jgi:hypothetical protein
MSCMKAQLKEVRAPFNLKNINLQNKFIQNTKLGAQIQSHQNPTP